MDRYEQDLDLTELNIDLSLDDILAEYQSDGPAVPSPAPQAEPEPEPDDGFFRIAGEPLEPVRRETPEPQPIPDAEHFWDLPDMPEQEESAPVDTKLPDSGESPAAEAGRKSSLPSEDEIRAYMEAFARGDYSDLDAGQSAPYQEPEFDPRFLTREDFKQGPDVMMYGDSEPDISPDED